MKQEIKNKIMTRLQEKKKTTKKQKYSLPSLFTEDFKLTNNVTNPVARPALGICENNKMIINVMLLI